MFAHDLCHSQVEYLRSSIDFNRKDRATRGALAAQALGAAGAPAGATSTNIQFSNSIVNSGLSGLGYIKLMIHWLDGLQKKSRFLIWKGV